MKKRTRLRHEYFEAFDTYEAIKSQTPFGDPEAIKAAEDAWIEKHIEFADFLLDDYLDRWYAKRAE